MATLEQKEALIEAVSQIQALICRKTSSLNLNDDEKRLVYLREFLYSHYPEEINFGEIITELKEIKGRYENLPNKE